MIYRDEPARAVRELRAVRAKVYPNVETWSSLLAIERAALCSTSVSESELLRHHSWAPKNLAAQELAAAASAAAVAAAVAAAGAAGATVC